MPDMNTETISATTENKVPRRRRSYVINPSFQWKYTLMAIATVFILSGFMTVVLFNVLHQQARARVMAPMSVTTVDNLRMIGVSAAAFGVVVALALGVSVFVFTHRIAGPIHVIGRALEDLAVGRIPQTRSLRQSDEFKDVHEVLCATVDRIKVDRNRQVETLTELYNLATSAAAGTDPDGKTLREELVRRIDEQRNRAIDSLGVDAQRQPQRSTTVTSSAAAALSVSTASKPA